MFFSAPSRGLQHKGKTPIDTSIKVEATESEVILQKGKFTTTDGTDYILPKDKTIKIEPSPNFSKDISVSIVERPDGKAFLWIDERRHMPCCLHAKNATSPVMVEVYRTIVDEDFKLPPNYQFKQYIIGRKWLEICPTNPPKDCLGENNSHLCEGCPLEPKKGRIGGIKHYTYSFINCLTPTRGTKRFGNPLQGRRHHPFKFMDKDGLGVWEIPHFAIRAEDITDKLIYNPEDDRFEDKPKKETPREIMLKKPDEYEPTAKKELLGVVRTRGRPAMPWRFRDMMDRVVKFLRSKFPNFRMKTVTEMRKEWEEEVKGRIDDFTEQAESL